MRVALSARRDNMQSILDKFTLAAMWPAFGYDLLYDFPSLKTLLLLWLLLLLANARLCPASFVIFVLSAYCNTIAIVIQFKISYACYHFKCIDCNTNHLYHAFAFREGN